MIYQSTEPQKVIAFEDLKELGYFMFPRIIPTEKDTELIFSKLGQYHAATFKLAAEVNIYLNLDKGTLTKQFNFQGHKDLKRKGGVFNLGDMDNLGLFRDTFSFFKELVETLPGFEEASEKLSKISFDKIVNKCRQIVNAPGTYEVLNHGDYYIKNMMFKGKNGIDLSEIVMVKLDYIIAGIILLLTNI